MMRRPIQQFFKDTLISFLVAALLVPTPFVALVALPDKTEAAVPAAGIIAVPANDLINNFKEYFADGTFAWVIAKQLLRAITNDIVAWINSDFQGGGPAFLRNPDQFFGNIADEVAGDFIVKVLGSDAVCKPFRFQIAVNIAMSYNQQGAGKKKCTLTDIVNNIDSFISGNFSEGGWRGWLSLTQQNSPYEQYLDIQSQIAIQIGDREFKLNRELQWGQGFLGFKKCVQYERYTPVGAGGGLSAGEAEFVNQLGQENNTQNGGRGKCIKYVTETPGAVINGQLQNALGSDFRQLEAADEIDEILGALANFLVRKALGAVGLFGLGQSDYDSYSGDINDDNSGNFLEIPEIFGPGSPTGGSCTPGQITNFALRKPNVLMSSEYSDGDQGGPRAANDGSTNGSGEFGSAITEEEEFAWWQVDLGQIETIDEVKIFKRAESTLQNYYIIVSKLPFSNRPVDAATIASSTDIKAVRVGNISVSPQTTAINADGRYVRIQLDNAGSPEFLQLAEVEVYGTPKLDPSCTEIPNNPNNPTNPGGPIGPGCTGSGCQPVTDSAGWSTFTQRSGSKKIYVSASGRGDGLTEQNPTSLADGLSKISANSSDWLLLKKGDTFNEAIGTFSKAGFSASQPILIGSYGTGARPKIVTTGRINGIDIRGARNLAIVGIHFASRRTGSGNGSSGIEFGGQKFENILIEDVKVEGYQFNIRGTGNDTYNPGNYNFGKNFTLRRSIITGAYHPGSGDSRGMYMHGVDGILIEENVFYHNGWFTPGSGAVSSDLNPPTSATSAKGLNQNLYLQYDNSPAVTVRNNIFASGSWSGVQVRNGGVVEGNVLVRNNHGILMGIGQSIIKNNFVGEQERHVAGTISTGIEIAPTNSFEITGNIVAPAADSEVKAAMTIESKTTYKGGDPDFDRNLVNTAVRNYNGTIKDNIFYKAGHGIQVIGTKPNAITVTQNVFDAGNKACYSDIARNNGTGLNFSRNAFNCPTGRFSVGDGAISFSAWQSLFRDQGSVETATSFVDPNRTIASYHGSIGGGSSYESFMVQAIQQSKDNWREAYTTPRVLRYLQDGFKKR